MVITPPLIPCTKPFEMKKNFALFICSLFAVLGLNAQNDSTNEALLQAKELLAENSPFNDGKTVVNLIEPLADGGNAEAQNLLGVLYTKGFGTGKDMDRAFELFKKAAEKGDINAQYNLGRLYKTGAPNQKIDFDKAITWFKRAAANGHQRATYSLGYLHYKGLGVPQDYKKAVAWFSKSSDPMAIHFLGLSHYQGYGVPANKEKALELLLENDIPNSRTLLTYIQQDQKKKNERNVKEAIETKIAAESTDKLTTKTVLKETATLAPENEPLATKDILGDWEGKWVQYDWSGKKVERILPLRLALTNTEGTLEMTYTLMETTKTVDAFWQEGYLYFNEPLTLTLPRLYSSNPKELSLEYELLSLGLEKFALSDGTPLLMGGVDTFITNWSEHGQPTKVALLPKGSLDIPKTVADVALLEALEEQKEHFIKLYPVPFQDNLTIAYELEVDAEVQAQVLSLNGGNVVTVTPKTLKKAGNHRHSIALGGALPKGLYVVRLTTGDRFYTRLIIKN